MFYPMSGPISKDGYCYVVFQDRQVKHQAKVCILDPEKLVLFKLVPTFQITVYLLIENQSSKSSPHLAVFY